jgi:hypothetical protein
MEAIKSNKGLTATDYVLIAFPAALLMSVYLLGNLAIADRFGSPKACHLDVRSDYAVPRG